MLLSMFLLKILFVSAGFAQSRKEEVHALVALLDTHNIEALGSCFPSRMNKSAKVKVFINL